MGKRELCEKINNLNHETHDYWDFRGTEKSERDFVHNFCTYPAMMVPKMQRELLKLCVDDMGLDKLSLLDPFAGSGTVLVEGMLQGLDVTGIDINPLAILLCKVKTTILDIGELQKSSEALIQQIKNESVITENHTFNGINKWFTAVAIRDLSKIRAEIIKVEKIEYRRFFWAAFCEVVRLVSNSRHCTYKLHIKPEEEIEAYDKDAKAIFENTLIHNIDSYVSFYEELKVKHLLKRGGHSYKGKVQIVLGDTIYVLKHMKRKFDLIFTSPPYGDNHTTVSYGQYSVMPLRWICIEDIDEGVNSDIIKTLYAIDNASLGGKTAKSAMTESTLKVLNKSGALKDQVNNLQAISPKQVEKVIVFYSDFDRTLKAISSRMNTGSYSVWTVGNRKVAKQEITMHRILEELSQIYEFELVTNFSRKIYNKRMPEVNAYKGNKAEMIQTMTKEQILIFQKG